MQKDAYYFPHDSNARNDEKILFMRSKYKIEGYGLYWLFVEAMHEQNDGKLTCGLIDGLAENFNVDITLLKQFYNDAITCGLFVTDSKKYWSERVIRNKQSFDEKKIKKSNAGKAGMLKRWGKNNTVITEDNTDITKHNKGKESKGKEIKESKENNICRFTPKINSYTQNKKLIEALNDFVEFRNIPEKKKKAPLTEKAFELALKELTKHGSTDSIKIQMIEQSILNGWTGIFPIKGEVIRNGQSAKDNSKFEGFDSTKFNSF